MDISKKILLGLTIGCVVLCIIGIILANITPTSSFNFLGAGVAIAIVFGFFTFISLIVFLIEISSD